MVRLLRLGTFSAGGSAGKVFFWTESDGGVTRGVWTPAGVDTHRAWEETVAGVVLREPAWTQAGWIRRDFIIE